MTNTTIEQKRIETAQSLGASAAATHRYFSRALNRLLAAEGLTHRQFLLLHQIHTLGPMSQSELAEFLAVEGQTLVRLLDTMEREGWVRRVPDVTDRRIKRIELATSPERLERAFGKFRLLQIASLAEFNAEELDTFLRLHLKMSHALTDFAKALETEEAG